MIRIHSNLGWSPASLTWNALNLPITVATSARTTTATYDALGMMVEMDATASPRTTGSVYRPDGALLAIYNYSSGLTKGQVPLPGGSTAIYNASGLSYIRHKDWTNGQNGQKWTKNGQMGT